MALDKEQVVKEIMGLDKNGNKIVEPQEVVQGVLASSSDEARAQLSTKAANLGLFRQPHNEAMVRQLLDNEVGIDAVNEKGEKGVNAAFILANDGKPPITMSGFLPESEVKGKDTNKDGKVSGLELLDAFMSKQTELQKQYHDFIRPLAETRQLWADISKADKDDPSKGGGVSLEELTEHLKTLAPEKRAAIETQLNFLDLKGTEITEKVIDASMRQQVQYTSRHEGQLMRDFAVFRGIAGEQSTVRASVVNEEFVKGQDADKDGITTNAEFMKPLLDAQKYIQENPAPILDPEKMQAPAGTGKAK